MRIAMPTDDRKTLAAHFGRAGEFAVYEASNGEALLVEFRTNMHTHGHGHGHEGGHDHADGKGHGHSHDFDRPLGGVDVVICRGLGKRAREAVERIGAALHFTREDDLPTIASMFLNGKLEDTGPGCGCDH